MVMMMMVMLMMMTMYRMGGVCGNNVTGTKNVK